MLFAGPLHPAVILEVKSGLITHLSQPRVCIWSNVRLFKISQEGFHCPKIRQISIVKQNIIYTHEW